MEGFDALQCKAKQCEFEECCKAKGLCTNAVQTDQLCSKKENFVVNPDLDEKAMCDSEQCEVEECCVKRETCAEGAARDPELCTGPNQEQKDGFETVVCAKNQCVTDECCVSMLVFCFLVLKKGA
jgi:hypothetical protein